MIARISDVVVVIIAIHDPGHAPLGPDLRYNGSMERVARVFDTPEAADRADDAYYASLTPEARVDLLLELVARYRESLGEADQRLARVCRVVDLEQS